jgi:RNA recognition motif-containing protein
VNLESPPIHTVFLRNLASDITTSDLKLLAEEFGPTQSAFSLANRRGIGFVTFFDSRDAERCVNGLEAREVHGREVHTSYAYAASDDTRQSRLDHCATVTARLAGAPPALSEDLVRQCLSQCGEVKSVARQEGPDSFTVKFYDLRATKKAVAESGRLEIGGEKVLVELNPKEDDGCKGKPKDLEMPFPPKGRGGRDRDHEERPKPYAPPFPLPPPYPRPPQAFPPPYAPPPHFRGNPPYAPPFPPRFALPPGAHAPPPAFPPPGLPPFPFQPPPNPDALAAALPPPPGAPPAPEKPPAAAPAAGEEQNFTKQLASLLKFLD